MFDIGWSEMAVIMLVALVVIGPKDLPRLARSLGQWVAKGRAMAREFQRSLEEMAREAELDDVKREIEKVGRTNLRQTIEKTIDPTGELGRAFDPNSRDKAPTKVAAASSANGEVKVSAASSANGEAKEPVTEEPEPAAAPESTVPPEIATATKAPPQPETATAGTAVTSKAAPRAKTTAKPKSATKSKTVAKPRATAKPRTAGGTAPKPASSEST